MRNPKSFLIPFCLLSIFLNASANLTQHINKILAKSPQPVHVGIIIRSAKSNKLIYQRNTSQLFSPASTQKLFVATAALDYLGPNFTYKTELFVDGPVIHHNLKGDVVIRFSGDPELSNDDLQELIEVLKDKGVKKIEGKIKLDITAFNNVPYPPGWLWDDLSYSYAAPLTTSIINKNKFVLRFTPAKKLGDKPVLSVDIPNNIIKFDNQLKTTAGFIEHCPVTIYSDAHNHFALHGCLNKAAGRQRRILATRDPIPYVKAMIRQSLEDESIKCSHRIILGNINKNYHLLGSHHSPPLRKLLKDMLKKSDNLITDSLLKEIGRRYYHTQGNWSNGVRALEHILKPTGINFKHGLINDGAGLSRYNLLSPQQFSKLLEYIYHKPSLRHILMEAVPIAGIDGTLVERMFSEAKDKRVRAKTGSMTGISALAGFIYSRHLGVLSFTIMINGFVGKNHPFTHLEDRICEYLAHYKGKQHG
jgi:serine-type D-Ala-D-Ala carboxypeptidase/endopeptidase (penicillin-binding protein 4)